MKAALIAAHKGFRTLDCFPDFLFLIMLLISNGVVNELKSLLHDIRCLSASFASIIFVFIPRSANVVADALSKSGFVSLNTLHFWSLGLYKILV